MTAPDRDPFAGSAASTPSISFKDAEVGTVQRFRVTEAAQYLQQTVFGSDGEKAYWPGKNGERGNPKMAAVLTGESVGVCYTKDGPTEDGDPVSLWAADPSDLMSKVFDAQKVHGAKYRVKPGDEVAVKLTAREPSGKGNPKNVHAVKITPGVPVSAQSADPFASGEKADPWSTGPAASAPSLGDEPPF